MPECDMLDCDETEGLTAVRGPEGELLDLCDSCRSAWPVETVPVDEDDQEVATDGGAVLDVDDLDRAAAALSGRYGLDFMQSKRPGCIELSATLACLKDVKDDLEDGAASIEVIEHDDAGDPSAGTLFLEPGDEQLEELLEIEREARPDGGGSGE